MWGSRCGAGFGHVKAAGLVVLVLGASACEFFRGYLREVRVTAPPSETCVRGSLNEVPGITVYAEGRSDTGFWFNWSADQEAEGIVSVTQKNGHPILRLATGWLNSCSPAALARGRIVMNSLYDRLLVNCGGLPELGAVAERRIRACDD